MLLRLGVQFVPAGHRPNLDPALFARVTRHQLIERSLHNKLLFAKCLGQLLDGRRLIRRIDNRFQRSSSLFIGHAELSLPCGS